MPEFFKKHDIALRLLSLVFALGCWFFAMGVNDPEVSLTVKDVPVTYTGEGALTADTGMQVISGRRDEVDVRVRGARSVVLGLKSSDITVYADVSGVENAGKHKITCDVRLPQEDLSIVNVSDLSLSLFIDSTTDITVPVIVDIAGTAAEGCSFGAAKVSPSTIMLTGPSSELSKISHARVNISTGTISESFYGEYDYDLITYDGTEYTNEFILRRTEKISVTVPVLMKKKVPLTVALHDMGTLSDENVSLAITPGEITIAGERSALDSIQSITIGTINLSDVSDSGLTTVMKVNVPDGITNISEIYEADVKITLRNITTRTFYVTRYKTINVPEGITATVLENERQITLRGSESFLSGLSADSITLVLDMSGVSSYTGKKTVFAEVAIDNVTSGVMTTGAYKVQVQLQRK